MLGVSFDLDPWSKQVISLLSMINTSNVPWRTTKLVLRGPPRTQPSQSQTTQVSYSRHAQHELVLFVFVILLHAQSLESMC